MNPEKTSPFLPSVSIVVPVYQGAGHIRDCLESLMALDYPGDLLEIIVVDNGSTDGTPDLVRAFPVQLLFETERGAGRARNLGIARARHDVVAFTDSDCVVRPDWLKKLVAPFADERVGGCGGKLVPAPPRNVVEAYGIAKDILSQERAFKREILSPPFFITANAAYRRRVLDEVGGFDHDFTVSGEDADLAWRVRWRWHHLRYVPEAVVEHRHRSNLRGMLRQIRGYGEGTSWLFWKHHRRLGQRAWLGVGPYQDIIRALPKIPWKLITAKAPLERWTPLLDVLGALAFLWGKGRISFKLGIKFY